MSSPSGDEQSPYPSNGAPTFLELIAFIDSSQDFLKEVLRQLKASKLLDEGLSNDLSLLAGTVERQANDLVQAIRAAQESVSGQPGQIEPNVYTNWAIGLNAHGLADHSDELRIKLAAYTLSHIEFMRHVDEALKKGKARKATKAARGPLRYLNVVLGSVAASIPIFGSVYQETKDEIHAAVDQGVDASGWFKRAKDWVIRGGPKKPIEQPTETEIA